MKQRNGFVSNSSSSSFIIRQRYVDELRKFVDFLTEKADEWEYELGYNEYIEDSIEDHGMDNVLLLRALEWILDEEDYLGRSS